MFSNAIVRTPGKSLVNGLTSASLGKPNYQTALGQHESYIEALIRCGLEVTVLPPCEEYPDSTFVEDVALCTPHCAIITNPGAVSRQGEIESIQEVIGEYFSSVEKINFPGTIEAGDIMMVGDHYYIGLSERTNQAGASQMISILAKYNLTGSVVTLTEVLHLKTGLGYLENNNLLACGEFLQKAEFNNLHLLQVDESESYAANSVWVNDRVLVPAGFAETEKLINNAGYQTIPVDVSEFRKLDGGLSCLSLRF